MTDCPDCGGTGRVADTPWSSWCGRLERNPENERDWPCDRCGESGVTAEQVEVLSKAALTPAPTRKDAA